MAAGAARAFRATFPDTGPSRDGAGTRAADTPGVVSQTFADDHGGRSPATSPATAREADMVRGARGEGGAARAGASERAVVREARARPAAARARTAADLDPAVG